MALFGCGAQGRTQLEAVLCERDIKKLLVFDKFKESADRLIDDLQDQLQIEMVYTEDTSTLQEADVICTATNSTAPLFTKEDIKKGVHINSIGSFQPDMQELDPYIIKDAKVYVDHVYSCIKESGDFIKPINDGVFGEESTSKIPESQAIPSSNCIAPEIWCIFGALLPENHPRTRSESR